MDENDKLPVRIRVENKAHWKLTLDRGDGFFCWYAEIQAKNEPEEGQIVSVELVDHDKRIVYRGKGTYGHGGVSGWSPIRVYPLGKSAVLGGE